MQTRTWKYGNTEDAYAWKDRIRQKLEMQGKIHKIKTPVKAGLNKPTETSATTEHLAIQERLQIAFLLDKTEDPNTYNEADIVSPIFHGPSFFASRCLQWEFEEAELRKLKGLDNFTAKQYLEFE
jgi:hypothetical protein